MNSNAVVASSDRRVLRMRSWLCVAAGAIGAGALGLVMAAAPEGGAAERPVVRVSPNEVIDLSKVSRISRSVGAEEKTVLTFYFEQDGQQSNFAIMGPHAESVWQRVTGAAQDWTGGRK